MVNNLNSGFMQVGYRNVDHSNPYKGEIRKKTWDVL